jgi:hypothetical protein
MIMRTASVLAAILVLNLLATSGEAGEEAREQTSEAVLPAKEYAYLICLTEKRTTSTMR